MVKINLQKSLASNKRATKNRVRTVPRSQPSVTKSIKKQIKKEMSFADTMRPILRNSLPLIGTSIGSAFGNPAMGASVGTALSQLFGHGDYQIQSNSLMSAMAGQPDPNAGPIVPVFSEDGKRGIRVVEREFLGDISSSGTLISGSSTFGNQNFPINPQNNSTFPWLSVIAAQFDQWEPNGLVFEFVSSSSEFNGTSQALGTVIMATDYDTQDPTFTSKLQMENCDYACSVKPSNNLNHGIECAVAQRPTKVLYTTPRSATPQFSTLGNFQIATVGCNTTNAKLGELWVSYDITFFKKVLSPFTEEQDFLNANGTAVVGQGYLSGATVVNSTGIVITPLIGVGSQITFPINIGSGCFLITYSLATSDVTNLATTVYTNCVKVFDKSVNAGGQQIFYSLLNITSQGASFQLGGLKATSTGTWSIVVTNVPLGTIMNV